MRTEAPTYHRDIIATPIVDAFAQKKINARAAEDIQDLRTNIYVAIARTKNLTLKDKEVLEQRLEQKIQTAPSTLAEFKSEVENLDSMIGNVKEALQHHLSSLDIDIKGELAKFEQMSLDEKEKYAQTLSSKIKQLLQLQEQIQAAEEHLRPEARKKIRQKFFALGIKEQSAWLHGKFETEILKEHQEMTATYNAFSDERKKMCSDFFKLSRNEKHKALDSMEKHLNKAYFDILKGPLARHFSSTSAAVAENYFRGISQDPKLKKEHQKIAKKEQALAALPGHMEEEAKLTSEFEKFPQMLQKKYEAEFFCKSYGEKEKILQKMTREMKIEAGIEKQKQELFEEYKTALAEERKKGVISAKTEKAFLFWFEELGSVELRQKAKELLLKKEIPAHRERLAEFDTLAQQLDAKTREQLTEKFLEASYDERLQIIEEDLKQKLKRKQEAAETKNNETTTKPKSGETKKAEGNLAAEIPGMKYAARLFIAQEKFTDALKLYQIIHESDPKDQEARQQIQKLNHILGAPQKEKKETAAKASSLPHLVTKALEEKKQTAEFREQCRIISLGLLLAKLARNAERTSGGTVEAGRRTRGLKSHEQQLQTALQKHTKGHMIIDRRSGMARNVQTFSIPGLESLSPEKLNRLQRDYGGLQHNQALLDLGCPELQPIDSQEKPLNGAAAYAQALAKQSQLKYDLAAQIAPQISQQTGQSLNQQLIEAVVSHITNRDLQYDLAG